MPVLGVIPARLGSRRLAGKPLQQLGGAPLIVRVWERVCRMPIVDEVVVATDAPAIREAVERVGGRAVLTSPLHESGTDRVAEAAAFAEFARYDVIVNVQGDEPFLPEAALAGAVGRVQAGDDVGTAAAPLDPARAEDPGIVKVVMDGSGRALYFSRAAIPHQREPDAGAAGYWQHLGIYAAGREALRRWVAAPPSDLERLERLEQLRALELGLTIGVARLQDPVLPGIDTAADLARAERHWSQLAYEGRA